MKTQAAGSPLGSAILATAVVGYYVWYAAKFALHAHPCHDVKFLAALQLLSAFVLQHVCRCPACVRVDKQKGLTAVLCFGQVAAS